MRSIMAKEESKMLPAESCVYSDESELELRLGLSIGVGKAKVMAPGGSWQQFPGILTTKNFDSVVSAELSSSSSSSSVTKDSSAGFCGVKRSADPRSPPPGRQVVGWPPVRTYRVNSLTSHAKQPATEDFFSKGMVGDNMDQCPTAIVSSVLFEKGRPEMSCFVKVTMDGIPIGRKLDLNALGSYKTLARTLVEMFQPIRPAGSNEENAAAARHHPRFVDGLSEFVVIYRDKDGDWMLVGDVPWDMFVHSVRRLRIMRRSEANGNGLAAL